MSALADVLGPVTYNLLAWTAQAAVLAAAAAVTDAVARGDVTPNEASALSNLVGNTAKAIETFVLSGRLARWASPPMVHIAITAM